MHIVWLSPNSTSSCWEMHGLCAMPNGNWQTWHLYFNVQRDEEEVPFHQQCGVWILVFPRWHQVLFKGQQNEYVLPLVSNTWLLKIGIDIWREKVPMLELTMFQLQDRETFLPRCRLSTIWIFPIPLFRFLVPIILDAYSTSRTWSVHQHRLQRTRGALLGKSVNMVR